MGYIRPLWILLGNYGFYWANMDFTNAIMDFTRPIRVRHYRAVLLPACSMELHGHKGQ